MRAFNFQKGMNFPIDMGTLFSIKNPEFGKIVPDYLVMCFTSFTTIKGKKSVMTEKKCRSGVS